MKIRLNFISNSSSTSFTCDICGRTESGMDCCLEDCGMVESSYGVYCEDHLLTPLSDICHELYAKEYSQGECDEEDDWPEWEVRSEIPAQHCPIFNLKNIPDPILLTFLLKEAQIDKEDVAKKIRQKFANYSFLQEYLKG